MSDFHLSLGLLSMALLFVAGLLALVCQYWQNRQVLSGAIALGILGGLGVAGFFCSLLFPPEILDQLGQWTRQNPVVINAGAIGFCVGLAYWREQQDQHQGKTSHLFKFSNRPRDRYNRNAKMPEPLRTVFPGAAKRVSSSKLTSPSPVLTQPSPQLMRRLNSLTHDPKASVRLVTSILRANPGCSADWAADKAIWQIKRDRCH